MHTGLQPSQPTGTHVGAYFAFLHVMDLPPTVTLHNLVVFIEYLHQNLISHKVITSYVFSIRSTVEFYNLATHPFTHPAVSRFLRSINITSHFSPTPGAFMAFRHYTILSLPAAPPITPSESITAKPVFSPLHFSQKGHFQTGSHCAHIRKFQPSTLL